MTDRYGYIGIETLLNFCSNQKDHCVTPNDFMRMNRVKIDERPHGEWKIDSEYGYIFHCVCSKCNTDVMKYISGSENWWLNSVPYFCPNCGADMRKEGEADG